MKDPFGRPLNSIRISVNEECNLNCTYCHHEGQEHSEKKMSPAEIEKIVEVAAGLGVRAVKFTGGEPLCRKDIAEIVRRSAKHIEDLSLTTNGTLLAPMAAELKEAGLKRVNVSMDTVDPDKYREITGSGTLADVLAGIKAAVKAGLHPVKVNIVALPEFSPEDVLDTAKMVWAMGGRPQVIEVVDESETDEHFIQVEALITRLSVSVRERGMHRRKIYTLEDNWGETHDIEVVRPMHNTRFCANCTRLRVTSGGQLKPCLMHNRGLVDVLGPLRDGAPDEKLREQFIKALANRVPYWT